MRCSAIAFGLSTYSACLTKTFSTGHTEMDGKGTYVCIA